MQKKRWSLKHYQNSADAPGRLQNLKHKLHETRSILTVSNINPHVSTISYEIEFVVIYFLFSFFFSLMFIANFMIVECICSDSARINLKGFLYIGWLTCSLVKSNTAFTIL